MTDTEDYRFDLVRDCVGEDDLEQTNLDEIRDRARKGTVRRALDDRADLVDELDRTNERIEKARAACSGLGDLAVGVLAALDGDQALRDPHARSADA
jgi:hypothetical protein